MGDEFDNEKTRLLKIIKKLLFFLIVFISLGILTTYSSTAKNATLKVTRRVVVPIDLNPTDIRRGADGNYVVTGSIFDYATGIWGAAGAVKLDPNGKILWRYTSPIVSISAQKTSSDIQSYTNSVEMNDGSIFLFASIFNVPETGLKKSALLLTHLDSNGNLINEQYFPLNRYQSVATCAKWGDSLVVLGGFSERSGDEFKSGADIWYFNNNSKLIWERKFMQPNGNERNIISKGFLYLLIGDDARDETDFRIPAKKFGSLIITRMSTQGEVKELGQVKGFLGAWGKIAEPTVHSNDSDIYMVGATEPSDYSLNKPNRVVVKFDSDMKEISRTQITNFPSVGIQRVFSQADGSLFYFGSVAKPFSNLPHMGVAYTNSDFSHQAELAIVPDDFDDFPYVNVATPTSQINQFVAVNRLQLKGFYKDIVKRIVDSDIEKKIPPSTTHGTYLVLQFIQLTN